MATLKLINRTQNVISIAGDDNANFDIPKYGEIDLTIDQVQHDQLFLTTLIDYINDSFVTAKIDNVTATTNQIEALRYAPIIDDSLIVSSKLWSSNQIQNKFIELRALTLRQVQDKLTPFWETDIIYDEPFWFIKDLGDPEAAFGFPYTSILNVKKRSTGAELDSTTDYALAADKITLPTGTTTVMYKTLAEMFPAAGSPFSICCKLGDPTTHLYINTLEFLDEHTTVTYRRTLQYIGYEQPNLKDNLNVIHSKLNSGQDVKIGIYGDSISDGASSTWYENKAPGNSISPKFLLGSIIHDEIKWTLTDSGTGTTYDTYNLEGLPYWLLFCADLARQYPNQTISFFNRSYPGAGATIISPIYADLLARAVEIGNWDPDFVFLAWGANDAAAVQTEGNYGAGVEGFVDAIKGLCDADIMLISTQINNPDWSFWGTVASKYADYKDELDRIAAANTGTIVADMSAVAFSIYKMPVGISLAGTPYASYNGLKPISSVYANNINHGSDWMHTIYAQVTLRASGFR